MALNYQKKARAVLLKVIREAGGTRSFPIERNSRALTILAKMCEEGLIFEVKSDVGTVTYSTSKF
jgi:hypothetical protein